MVHIITYSQFVTGEIVLIEDSKRDELHATKVQNTKEQYIIISSFKTDVPLILGGLGEGKESTKPLT